MPRLHTCKKQLKLLDFFIEKTRNIACTHSVERPETHTMRQATLHVCLPSLMGDGDTGIEIVCSEEKKCFVLGGLKSSQNRKKISYTVTTTNQPRKDPFQLSSPHSP
jgi:hypothetical protein